MDFIIGKTYHLSTDGYSFSYRHDKYNPMTIHVEMFNDDGEIVHKQMAYSVDYGVNKSHHDIINELEVKIMLKELDPTGLKQRV